MRAYEALNSELAAAGAVLYVLTPDTPDQLHRARKKHGFDPTFVPVTPETFAAWGLENPAAERLPHPTTMIIAPSGELLFRETHTDYKLRARPRSVLTFVSESRAH